ncbi:MAG: PH domain-containing protein [Halomonadaceae bacterium]|nr:PH domain-containing protein [Halomonadaceae bacterium]
MTLVYYRSYISLWNYWLMLVISLAFLLVPSMITDLANSYLPLDSMLGTVDSAIRVIGLIMTGWSGGSIMIKRAYSRYTVYEDRLEAQYGILSRKTSTANFSHIRSVDIEKKLPGMLLGYGDLLFGTAGTSEVNVIFHGIADPEIIREKVRRLRNPAPGSIGSDPQEVIAPSVEPLMPPPEPITPHESSAPASVSDSSDSTSFNVGINHSERPGSNPLPYDADSLNQELERRIHNVTPEPRE